MKTFPSAFATEIAKPTGASPIWLLKLTIATVDYYLSDSTHTIAGWAGGVTTRPWVASWGRLRESISGALGEIRVGDFDCTLLADLDASPNALDLALADTLEKSPAILYLWAAGLDAATDPPQAMFSGYVRECQIPDEQTVSLVIEDASARLQHPIGRVIDATSFPGCDPDDVGKIVPICYGTVKGLPAPALKAGALTTLQGALTNVATSLTVVDPERIVVPSTMRIDTEQVRVTAATSGGNPFTIVRAYNGTTAAAHVDGSVIADTGLGIKTTLSVAMTNVQTTINLTVTSGVAAALPVTVLIGTEQVRITAGSANPWTCTRGYAGTTAAAHAISSAVAEVTGAPFVFAANDGEVASLDRVRIRAGAQDIDCTDLVTTYQGGSATSLAGFDGLATVGITAAQAASILARVVAATAGDPGHIHGGSLQVASVWFDTAAPANPNNYLTTPDSPYLWLDHNFGSSGVMGSTGAYGDRTQELTINASISFGGVPTRARLCVSADKYQGGTGSLSITGVCCGVAIGVSHSSSPQATVKGSWVTLTGKTWADFLDPAQTDVHVNDPAINYKIFEIWLEVEYDPSTSSTTTGITANSVADQALGGRVIVDVTRGITAPDDVVADLLARYGGGMSCALAGAFPAGYRIDGALIEAQPLLQVAARVAFEARAWFRLVAGAGKITVRPDTLTSARTVTACRIDGGRKVHSRRKAAIDDVLNKIVARYGRDYDRPDGDDAYANVLTVEDATSQADYGLRERPELFRLGWVTDATMAASVAAFYLGRYKRRPWRHEFEVFLDQADLEFGDQITLGFGGGIVGEVTEAGLSPGSIDAIDTIALVVEV